MCSSSLSHLLVLAAAMVLPGCGWSTQALVPAPLAPAGQVAEIRAIVPEGTPRADAVRRLEEAGIAGTYGSSESIYYCDVWNRGDGARWHLGVALLFDEQGRFYETLPNRTGGEQPAEHGEGQAEVAAPAARSDRSDPFQR